MWSFTEFVIAFARVYAYNGRVSGSGDFAAAGRNYKGGNSIMKKAMILALVFVFACALAACGKDTGDDAKKNETKVAATETPTPTSAPTLTSAPTSEPTPTTPSEVTPTEVPKKTTTVVKHILADPRDNQGTIVINSLAIAPSNSVIYVIVKKTGETTEDQTGRSIGGFTLDNSTKEFEFEFVLDHNPEMDEEIRIPVTLSDLLKIAMLNPDAGDAHKAIITIKDSAYTFLGVDLEFEQ